MNYIAAGERLGPMVMGYFEELAEATGNPDLAKVGTYGTHEERAAKQAELDETHCHMDFNQGK